MARPLGDSFMRQNPLQVWLPQLGPQRLDEVVARDAQRAFEAWQCDDVVFLLPELRHIERFGGPKGERVLCVPSESLDRLSIFHVDREGWVAGPGEPSLRGGRG